MVDMKFLQVLFGGIFDLVYYGYLKFVEMLVNLIGLMWVIIIFNNVFLYCFQLEVNSVQCKYMFELVIVDKLLFIFDECELKCNVFFYIV